MPGKGQQHLAGGIGIAQVMRKRCHVMGGVARHQRLRNHEVSHRGMQRVAVQELGGAHGLGEGGGQRRLEALGGDDRALLPPVLGLQNGQAVAVALQALRAG